MRFLAAHVHTWRLSFGRYDDYAQIFTRNSHRTLCPHAKITRSYDNRTEKTGKLWLIDYFERVTLLELALERFRIRLERMAAAATNGSVGSATLCVEHTGEQKCTLFLARSSSIPNRR